MEKTNLNTKFNIISKTISLNEEGLRLDKFLGSIEEIQSRSRGLQLIESELISVNKKKALKPSYVLKIGDEVEISIPIVSVIQDELLAIDLNLEFVYEDEYLLVVNKPAGLVVHPAVGHEQDTLVNGLIYQVKDLSMKFGENRPGIVHRLDKDTSGLMVVAKKDSVHEALTQQFKNRTIHRFYLAVVVGHMNKVKGTIQSFLARHPNDRKRYASVLGTDHKIIHDKDKNVDFGKWAVTDYEVLKINKNSFSYVKLKLHTGRTHQIRVHLSELGYPIIGDEVYGQRRFSSLKNIQKEISQKWPRLALHAAELGFEHPITKERLYFKKPWPEDLSAQIKSLDFDPNIDL